MSRYRHNTSHLASLSSLLFQSRDQLGVEKCQQQQRTAQHHDEVEDVVVDDAEDAVFSDGGEEVHRRCEATAVVQCRAGDVDALVLEEPRDVVQDGGNGDVADVALTAWQRAQGRRVVRLADGRVAMKRDQYDQQDGGRQRHQVYRPQVWHDDHVEAME